jgi:hypothetical protein
MGISFHEAAEYSAEADAITAENLVLQRFSKYL